MPFSEPKVFWSDPPPSRLSHKHRQGRRIRLLIRTEKEKNYPGVVYAHSSYGKPRSPDEYLSAMRSSLKIAPFLLLLLLLRDTTYSDAVNGFLPPRRIAYYFAFPLCTVEQKVGKQRVLHQEEKGGH